MEMKTMSEFGNATLPYTTNTSRIVGIKCHTITTDSLGISTNNPSSKVGIKINPIAMVGIGSGHTDRCTGYSILSESIGITGYSARRSEMVKMCQEPEPVASYNTY